MSEILKQFNYEEALNFLQEYSKAKFNPEYEITFFWLVSKPKTEGKVVNTWDIYIGKNLWEHNSEMATKGINDCVDFLKKNKKDFLEAFITSEQDYHTVRKLLEIKYQ